MAANVLDTGNVIAWPSAKRHLEGLAQRFYRQAARADTEFRRGEFAGRGQMCEELMNLPETLRVLEEHDAHEREQGDGRSLDRQQSA